VSLSGRTARAVIYGCSGLAPTPAERAFFRDADPLGFILFARNVDTPDQVRALVEELRQIVGREDAPVLIDQEGGRVRRLKPPHWPDFPPAAKIGALAPGQCEQAAELMGRALAAELIALGIDVDCAPVVDLRRPETHQAIGDRAFGGDPATVARLARALARGLLAGGVMPVIKHMPGHGRATVDSHLALPRVTAPVADLDASDFAAFRALADLPWGMTAHVVYSAIDPDLPATLSPTVIRDVIRGAIGFDGFLLTDDIGMNALGGDFGARAAGALAAGCDCVLHCSGKIDEMAAVAAAIGPLASASLARFARARAVLAAHPSTPNAGRKAHLQLTQLISA
jgi:beta-N-acetylhexosaminidase